MSAGKKKSKNEKSFDRDLKTGKLILQPLPLNFFQCNGGESTKSSARKIISAKKKSVMSSMFETDPETGRLSLIPLNLESLKLVSVKQLSTGKKTEKNSTKIKQPRGGTDDEGIIRAHKVRKLDFGLSKKPSQNLKRLSQGTNSRSYLKNIKNLNQKPNINLLKIQNAKDTSGLLDLEEVEDSLIHKNSALRAYPFKSPKLVPSNLKCSATSKIAKKISTPPRMSRISEEQVSTAADDNSFKISQITIPKVRKILQNVDSTFKVYQKAHEKYVEEMDKYSKAYKTYQQQHEKNMSMLADLLTTSQEENKENILERISITLEATSTPLKAQSYNLRVSTLKKNFVEKNLDTRQSPKTENALKLYNSLRLGCTFLETPKLEQKTEKKCSKSAAKQLSDTILNQCLLLQGTPRKN